MKEEIELRSESGTKRKKHFTVWFNCWRYEKEDELWAAFAINLMGQLSGQLSLMRLLLAQFKLRVLRLRFKWKGKDSVRLNIFIFLCLICLSIASIAYLINEIAGAVNNTSSMGNIANSVSSFNRDNPLAGILLFFTAIVGFIFPTLRIGKDLKDTIVNPFDFSKFSSNPNYTEHISLIENFHSDFGKIIESYVGDARVYVFVDDLDRCETPKAAELMQALNLMISDKSKVYYCIGMDRKTVSAGIAAKNGTILKYLADDGLEHGLEYGNNFIEKFIQLPFKVPIPKKEDLKGLLNLQKEQEITDKSKGERKDKEEIDCEERSENNELSEDFKGILEMVAPALDRNPRRMKQFFNLFRFQRTFGFKTGLFSDRMGPSSEYWWNCKKLAKFVAISIKWPSLIAALDSDMTLLGQLQDYAIGPEKEEAKKKRLEEEMKLKEKQEREGKLEAEEKKEPEEEMRLEGGEKKKSEDEMKLEEKEKTKKEEIKILEKWTREKKLIELLREGCVEGGKLSEDYEKYILSGLDFSKLLDISPEFTSSDSLPEIIKSIEFVRIPAGEFMMGSPPNEQDRYDNEGSVHKVTIKNSFSMSKYPVTQKQWIAVMEFNPSQFKGEERPVENVSWNDVQEFIKRLNEIEDTDSYRLPSEAEWEYACRAGTTTRFCFGDDESKLGDYAWYAGNSDYETHPVGQRNPNPWGLYDMHGNVWEWCQDSYHSNYNGAPSDGSAWEDGDSSNRVLRGGSWNLDAGDCRSASHAGSHPGNRDSFVGFRLLRKL